jgi:hypothetical protein
MHQHNVHSVKGFCSSRTKTVLTVKVLLMDRSCCIRTGITSIHSESDENIMWCGPTISNDSFSSTLGDFLVGPYILPGRVSGCNYLTFFWTHLNGLSEDEPFNRLLHMRFQDHITVLKCISGSPKIILDAGFDLGRETPVSCPECSRDLNPLGTSLGIFENQVHLLFREREREDLWGDIKQFSSEIKNTPGIFRHLQDPFSRRDGLGGRELGCRFEHLL